MEAFNIPRRPKIYLTGFIWNGRQCRGGRSGTGKTFPDLPRPSAMNHWPEAFQKNALPFYLMTRLLIPTLGLSRATEADLGGTKRPPISRPSARG